MKTVKIHVPCVTPMHSLRRYLWDCLYFHIFLVAQLSFTDSDCHQIPRISNNGVDTYSEKSERWWPDDLASKC